eukprot:19800-Chlamydomonas_euryale.AAC.1
MGHACKRHPCSQSSTGGRACMLTAAARLGLYVGGVAMQRPYAPCKRHEHSGRPALDVSFSESQMCEATHGSHPHRSEEDHDEVLPIVIWTADHEHLCQRVQGRVRQGSGPHEGVWHDRRANNLPGDFEKGRAAGADA